MDTTQADAISEAINTRAVDASIPAEVHVANFHGGLILDVNRAPVVWTVLGRYSDDGSLIVSPRDIPFDGLSVVSADNARPVR